jgi:uncharacterized protein
MANRFVKDPHEIVKPGQIVKVKVIDVDVKRQRIGLTMRLDDASGTGSRSGDARADANAGAARDPRDRHPPEPKRPPGRDSQFGDAMAIALAKLKK